MSRTRYWSFNNPDEKFYFYVTFYGSSVCFPAKGSIGRPGLDYCCVNGTLNNISATSLWTVVLMVETGIPNEKYQATGSHLQTK